MSDFDDDNDSDLIKDLRRQIRDKDKKLSEFSEQLGTLSKKDRDRSLKDVLTELKVPSKVASFYPSDKDASEESIKGWLTENADVFGLKLDAAPEGTPPAPPVPDAYERLQAIAAPSAETATGDAAMLQKINQATSGQELIDMIYASGGGGAS